METDMKPDVLFTKSPASWNTRYTLLMAMLASLPFVVRMAGTCWRRQDSHFPI